MKKNLLIVGSQGYLGSRLTEYLKSRGYNCAAIDVGFFKEGILTTPDFVDTVNKDARLLVEDDLEGFDALILLAGISNDPFGNLSSEKVYGPTLDYALRIASMCKKLGVKVAKPNCDVICIIGDGGFNMNLQELGTLTLQNLPIKIFILNNKSYGLIKQSQTTWLESRYVCVDIDSGVASPDFIKIAKAYNIKTKTIDSHDNLEASLKYVLEYNDGPILCDVKVDLNQEALPKSNFERPIEDMYPYLSKTELEENMNFDS